MSLITDNTNKDIFETILKANTAKLNFSGTTAAIGKNAKGRFELSPAIDSAVSNILNSSTMNTVTEGFFSGLNSTGEIIADSAQAVGGAVASVSKSVTDLSAKIEGYFSPVSESLKSINDMGKDFDKMIQNSFLNRLFKLKTSEVICMMFCIIVSFIPCEIRNKLYQTMMDIRNGITNVNATINEIQRVSQTAVEIPITANGSIKENVASLFKSNTNEVIAWKEGFTKDAKAPRVQTGTLQVPANVKTIVSTLVTLLTVLSKGQITLPVGINSGTFSISGVVMFVIRLLLMQMIDEFLTKIVAKVEEMLKKIMPQPCVGNIATLFINKIMAAIRNLKEFLLALIRQQFGESGANLIKWKKFGWYFKEIQDLLAMLKALNLILGKFADLIMVCGISPCNDITPEVNDIRNAIINGNDVQMTNIPATIKPITELPKFNNLDDLARNFAGIVNIDPQFIFVDANAIHVSMPDTFKNAPSMIQNLVDTPEFLAKLGNAYTVYKDNSNITIVYSFKRLCGSN